MSDEMKRMSLLVVLLTALRPFAVAQEPSCVFAKSWQRGAEAISEQTLRITLGPNQSEYATEVIGTKGGRYRLKVIHNPFPNVRMEHWQVTLSKIRKLTAKEAELPGYNLLVAEGPGPDKHHFPEEDFVGYFYPHEDPPVTIVGGVPLVESHFFYPIRAARYIRVEGFCVVLKVEDFRRNKSDGGRVDFVDLSVGFRSACPAEGCQSRQ